MRLTLIVFGTTCLLAGNLAMADASPAEERIGVGLGVTVGAVAGGPVGAILGAAIGAKFGEKFHRKNAEIDTLSAALDDKSARVGELEKSLASTHGEISALDSELRRMQVQSRPELVSLLSAGIEMDLLFRTEEFVLSDDALSRTAQLAATLAKMPDVRVQLDGFADERGDADYNQELSAQRAKHVRAVLVENGVVDSRISMIAHGEAPAADMLPDSLALQRKVRLRLFIEESPALAANPQ
ncbi:MAG: OmpA family protein [Woeseia sp.]|nr:OmpA family protein [Woeseia sp.]